MLEGGHGFPDYHIIISIIKPATSRRLHRWIRSGHASPCGAFHIYPIRTYIGIDMGIGLCFEIGRRQRRE